MQVKTNAVICQSIHQEANGKFILVGVVSGLLQTDGSSFEEEYCLFLNFHDLPEGEHAIQLKFITPENKSSVNSVDVSVPSTMIGLTLQFTAIPFTTTKPGLFSMFWKFSHSKKWSKLIDIAVELSVEIEDDTIKQSE